MASLRWTAVPVVVAVVVVVAGSTATGTGRPPTLKLLDTAPVSVRGTGFRARERVTITVETSSAERVRKVPAGPAGGFTVRLLGLSAANRCEVTATGVGNRGSRAKLAPQPACKIRG